MGGDIGTWEKQKALEMIAGGIGVVVKVSRSGWSRVRRWERTTGLADKPSYGRELIVRLAIRYTLEVGEQHKKGGGGRKGLGRAVCTIFVMRFSRLLSNTGR